MDGILQLNVMDGAGVMRRKAINMDQIVAVNEDEGGAVIELSTGVSTQVVERYEKVIGMLSSAVSE